MEKDTPPSFGTTLEGIKKGLGADGKGLDSLARKLLKIIAENPTQAAVALSRHGWVLTTQDEIDGERAAFREKLADAGKSRALKDSSDLIGSVVMLLRVAHDELGTQDHDPIEVRGYVSACLKVLSRLRGKL